MVNNYIIDTVKCVFAFFDEKKKYLKFFLHRKLVLDLWICMVLRSDGSLKYVAHMWSEFGYSICFKAFAYIKSINSSYKFVMIKRPNFSHVRKMFLATI